MLAAALGLCRAGAEANGASPSAPPKGGVWDLAAAMPEPRQEAGSAALGNTIYVIGGYGPDMPPSTLVQVYDAAANKWRQAAPIPDGLHHHPGVVAANGKIYVIGGFAGSFAKRVPVNTVWQYDPADDRWEKRAPMPTGRSGGSAAVVNNRLYVFGGEGNAENTSLGTFNQVEFYDTARDAWTELAPMPLRATPSERPWSEKKSTCREAASRRADGECPARRRSRILSNRIEFEITCSLGAERE